MKTEFRSSPSLILGLVRYGQVESTIARVKAIQGKIDRLIVRAKKGTLAGRRQALAVIGDKKIANKLVDEIAPKFGGRSSGFTRIFKIGKRKGDGAMMAKIEFVESQEIVPVAVSPAQPTPTAERAKPKTKDQPAKKNPAGSQER